VRGSCASAASRAWSGYAKEWLVVLGASSFRERVGGVPTTGLPPSVGHRNPQLDIGAPLELAQPLIDQPFVLIVMPQVHPRLAVGQPSAYCRRSQRPRVGCAARPKALSTRLALPIRQLSV
jgi:hypothetical protein